MNNNNGYGYNNGSFGNSDGFQGYQGNSGFGNNYQTGYPQQQGYGYNQPQTYQGSFIRPTTMSLSDFMRKVYAWMFAGLGITFGIGFILMLNEDLVLSILLSNPAIFYGLMIGEIVLVLVLSLMIRKLSPTAALIMFFVYSAVSGITLAPTLIYFGASSSIIAFAITAGLFGGMALFGTVTRIDLSKLWPLLLFSLFGLLVFTAVEMFFRFPLSDLLVGVIAIVIFTVFTAFDAQMIKSYYQSLKNDDSMLRKGAVIAAFNLYLDFINLFIRILSLFGKRR